jgi:hypothetical protein
MADKLDCALDLMRRLPPADVEDNLAGLIGMKQNFLLLFLVAAGTDRLHCYENILFFFCY